MDSPSHKDTYEETSFDEERGSPWIIRPFQPDDLEPSIRLWETWSVAGQAPSLSLADLVQALSTGIPAVVADFDGELVGAAFARISGQRGWVQRLVIAEPWRGRGIGHSLLSALESILHDVGVDRLMALIPPTTEGLFLSSGWTVTHDVSLAEKSAERLGARERLLRSMAAERYSDDMWSSGVAGTDAGETVERRVVIPLTHLDLANRLSVQIPVAILLFGPPGTGKTTFVKALAGRLGRPLVEWRRPGNGAVLPAQEMAAFFESAAHIDDVVLFLDEVEEFAAQRVVGSSAEAGACTNELLKALGRCRSGQARLMIAATNHVDRLDAAILRPGRFDLVLPVGPPDSETRRRIVEDRLSRTAHAVTNVEHLVTATVGFTTADIIHLLDGATHLAFESALAGSHAALTDDHLDAAIRAASPTLTKQDLAKFAEEARRFTRK